MAHVSSSDQPLQELKHEAVPGYLKAFILAFGIMSIYLAIILISSPGPAKKHHDHGDSHGHKTETSH